MTWSGMRVLEALETLEALEAPCDAIASFLRTMQASNATTA
jgi:hypothetical protein